jgi:nitroreductase/NAD-dependent dihydropyrimidine dehydrogenase PreA subunit
VDLIEVNRKTCRRDGICAATCPGGLIELKKGDYPKAAAGAEAECIRCGHCVAICPTGSLTHREMAVGECPAVDEKARLTAKQCEHILKSRRSVRVYRSRPVSANILTGLIETARYAPSGKNSQCVEWLVLARKDELKRLVEIAAGWMRWMIANKPDIASTMGMERIVRRHEQGEDEFLRNAPALIVTHARKENPFAPMACPIALAYFDLAARSRGLGCCWAGLFNTAATVFPPLREALSLPEGHQPFGSMMVGYPRFTYQKVPLRKAPRITWRV